MIVQALSAVYGAAASWRRRWYAQHPERARRLQRPVVSVGNLGVGGTGKTPAVAFIAQRLIERGERPSILSRGYGRRNGGRDVTVVSDGAHVLADVARAGDEPLLLARAVPGAPVLVCPNRHAAGIEAERRFDVTVHVLDDGFQHLKLARDVDLLMVDESDLSDRVLPGGRLREPLSSAAAAHAVIVVGKGRATGGVTAEAAGRAALDAIGISKQLGVAQAFSMTRRIGTPVPVAGPRPDVAGPVFAVAGIARPGRFFADLQDAGWTLTGSREFRDHHPFTQADVAEVVAAARASGASAIVTTEKDAVRLGALDLSATLLPAMSIAAVPLVVGIEPATDFVDWLVGRIRDARRR